MFSRFAAHPSPFALSLSKCRIERRAGFDKLSPNGGWSRAFTS